MEPGSCCTDDVSQVYRVQPLPQSLLPLVWDFGQLDTTIEELYIRQMVRRWVSIGFQLVVSRRFLILIMMLLFNLKAQAAELFKLFICLIPIQVKLDFLQYN